MAEMGDPDIRANFAEMTGDSRSDTEATRGVIFYVSANDTPSRHEVVIGKNAWAMGSGQRPEP
jgi:hypothetical protein